MGEQFTQKNGLWYKGCGCGTKQVDLVQLPEDSVSVFVQVNGAKVGPVTGQRYNFRANLVAVDVRAQDAAAWLVDGTARTPPPGFKGVLSRIDS
jgi:hypothetical protein